MDARDGLQHFPLLDPPVVRVLFKYLRLKDLVAARGVCQVWKDLATPLIEDRIDEFNIDFTHSGHGKNRNLILRYLEMLEGSNLSFSSFRLGGDVSMHLGKEYKALLNSFSESITKLQLSYHENAKRALTPAVFRDILLNKAPFLETLILSSLPEKLKMSRIRIFKRNESAQLDLKSLTIHFQYEKYREEEYSEEFMEGIFKASQQLEELTFESNYDSEEQEAAMLRNFLQYGRPELLKKLEMSHVNTNILGLLTESDGLRSAPLEVFKVGYVAVNATPNELEIFLNAHRNTLKDLYLRFCDYNNDTDQDPTPLQFPVMKNLKSLHLWLDVQTFVDLDYGDLFPELETLKITDANMFRRASNRSLMDHALFSLTSSPCPSVKELELPENLSGAGVMSNIARIFPNVLKLNLAAQRGEVLEALWNCWPNMERLAMSLILQFPKKKQYSRNLDSVFTGFTEEMVGQLNKELRKGNQLKLGQLEASREMPSIVNMKKLKYLIINGGPNLHTISGNLARTTQLTDVTLLTTLALMKNVMCFIIAPNTQQFSEGGINYLAHELELKKVDSTLLCRLVKYDWQEEEVKQFPFFYWDTI